MTDGIYEFPSALTKIENMSDDEIIDMFLAEHYGD